jgi:hypothetical protein
MPLHIPLVFIAGALFALACMALKDYFFSCPEMDEEIGEEDER